MHIDGSGSRRGVGAPGDVAWPDPRCLGRIPTSCNIGPLPVVLVCQALCLLLAPARVQDLCVEWQARARLGLLLASGGSRRRARYWNTHGGLRSGWLRHESTGAPGVSDVSGGRATAFIHTASLPLRRRGRPAIDCPSTYRAMCPSKRRVRREEPQLLVDACKQRALLVVWRLKRAAAGRCSSWLRADVLERATRCGQVTLTGVGNL